MQPFLHTPLWRALSAALLGLPLAFNAQAQVLPDAGQALESLEQSRPSMPAPAAIDLTLPGDATPASADTGPAIDVKRFAIDGNSAIASDELLALLEPLQGQSLTLGQLQAGAARITQLYRARGYPFANAYLPAQEVEDGLVRVSVLEGRLGEVKVDNQSRQQASVVDAPLHRLQAGDLLRGDALETSLLLLGDTPGVRSQASLQPGAEVGTSDLVVTVRDAPLISGSLGLDNYGNRYTGQYRTSANLQLNGALGLGEQIQLQGVLTSEKLRNYRLGYQMPVGPWSTRVGVSTSHLSYDLGKEFAALDAYGRAQVATVFVSQPLVRRRALSLNARLQHDQKRLTDDIGLTGSQNKKRSNVTTLGLDGNWRDGLGGGAVSQFGLAWAHGQLRLGSEAQQQRDARTTLSAGSFQVLTASLARWQTLSGPWSLHGRINGQWANKNLDSSEKMSLGGAYGVRAYPQGEATGDKGVQATLELRYALSNAWQLSGFMDGGRVQFQHKPWSTGQNHRNLAGAGLGVLRTGADWSLEAALAWKVSGSTATSAPDRSPRLWVKIQKSF